MDRPYSTPPFIIVDIPAYLDLLFISRDLWTLSFFSFFPFFLLCVDSFSACLGRSMDSKWTSFMSTLKSFGMLLDSKSQLSIFVNLLHPIAHILCIDRLVKHSKYPVDGLYQCSPCIRSKVCVGFLCSFCFWV